VPRLITALCLHILNLPNNTLTIDDLAEYYMFLVQVRCRHGCDEELGTVRSWSGVGHTQQEGLLVQHLEVLVVEFLPVYTLATCAIVVREVAALDHKLLDDAVEA
jgi:hypothetical protein